MEDVRCQRIGYTSRCVRVILAQGPCQYALYRSNLKRMFPEGNPNCRVARKSGRDPKFKEAFTIRFWQPLSLQHVLPFIGMFEDVQVEVRVGLGFSNLCKRLPLRCHLSDVWVLISLLFLFRLFFLFRIFVVVFASAPASASTCSLSLSLSLSLPPLGVSVYLSIFSARLPSNVSAIKTGTGAKLTAPQGLAGLSPTQLQTGPCAA